jgi:CHAD domain-containing protein
MEVDLGNLRKPIRELRKSLKSLPSDPPIKAVHNLRTRARRLEAISTALLPKDERPTRQLRKVLKPLRKAAGNVRDMDVLAVKALTLAGRIGDETVAQLLEHLQARRVESADELLEAVDESSKHARRRLKRFSKQVQKELHKKNQQEGPTNRLIDELRSWPMLCADNLHHFRIKVKELRYVLQLAEDASGGFVKALDKVKGQIGTWHDWHQLHTIAEEVLDARQDRAAVSEIAEIEKSKFDQALKSAQALRRRYLSEQSGLMIAEP